MANPQKSKGDNYEREISAYINEHTGLQSFRAPLSGGGKQFSVGNITAGSADIVGTPAIWPECKRTERFTPYEAIAQAERGIAARNSTEMPVVFTRRNRVPTGQSLVVMRLDDWLKFYKAYLNRTTDSPE
jgi:Holliday junction resolvase